ncbi:YjgN family protein [Pseudoduganella rhizocola]|uniref:YjgN family protein n=1 Tax=Pseudoduganella rhizocola TaxID=3382643 RepID=UPI0038B5480E
MFNEATAAAPAPVETREEITFSATGGEYFRIWIVNLLLTIVTLGIYSAWAKVRRNQYFYSSTRLAGSSFEYHGTPVAILKGRLIALALFGVYNLAFRISPAAGLAMFAVMAAAMPWLLWRSLQFSLHNSSYRGIRFGFDGSARQAYVAFLGMAVLSAISFGLLAPFAHQRLKKFQHSEARYGASKFSFDAPVSGFYKIYLVLFGLMVLGTVVFFGVITALVVGASDRAQAANYGSIVGILLIYPWVLASTWLFMAMLQNLVWNHTQLGAHRFQSAMRWGRLAFIYATNTVGIIFTLGFYTPFAKVRAMKYRLESISLQVSGGLDDVVAQSTPDVNATGEGMADFLGVDLSM